MNVWVRLMRRWSILVFGARYQEITPHIRSLRVLEEALELAQSEAVTEQQVLTILRQVYDKAPGQPLQELGGLLVCIAGYAATRKWPLEDVFWEEFERIMDPVIMERVRTRNLQGDKIGFERCD